MRDNFMSTYYRRGTTVRDAMARGTRLSILLYVKIKSRGTKTVLNNPDALVIIISSQISQIRRNRNIKWLNVICLPFRLDFVKLYERRRRIYTMILKHRYTKQTGQLHFIMTWTYKKCALRMFMEWNHLKWKWYITAKQISPRLLKA